MSKDVSAEIGFTFEAVLDAVQESSRGRWFLDEYKKRQGQFDSAKMMDAVSRIEMRVEGMAGHFTAADDLAKVRQAIAKTRNDIVNAQPETKGLSEEGRLFAHLADLARKAMPEQSSQAGIEQALRLVDEIDTNLNSNVMAFPAPAAKSADKYFQQDAAVFDQKPAPTVPKLVAVAEPAPKPAQPNIEKPAAAKPVAEPVATGAKLTITRVSKDKAQETPPESKPEVQVAPEANAAPEVQPEAKIELKAETVLEKIESVLEAPVEAAPAHVTAKVEEPKAEATEAPKPRIVIIRRKPEEIQEVPAALQASNAA
jgi:hypothetical protein